MGPELRNSVGFSPDQWFAAASRIRLCHSAPGYMVIPITRQCER
jgi:hypothetical protein